MFTQIVQWDIMHTKQKRNLEGKSMLSAEGKYNIKAVSQMLGIQAGTLRAWERRYHIIAPVRNVAGHRLYTEDHIKILKWLIQKVNQGFTISQAINLLENSELLTETEEKEGQKDSELVDKLLKALLQFDENQAHEHLNHAFSIYSIDKVAIDILGNLLVKIGDLWEHGEITSAHEHFASSFLRSKIGNIMHSIPISTYLPKVLAVCGPNEAHELGLLIFNLFLRRKGFNVVYLGAGISPDDMDIVIKEVQPQFLFISCTLECNLPTTLPLIDHLKNEFTELEIGLGGNAFKFLKKDQLLQYGDYLVGVKKVEWEKWIQARI
jgi:MerR family transcriptional regulator, light-induced transcriptional regulator